jgi:hypothetical protein
MIDYAAILILNYPGAQWTLNGDSYEGLDWLDSTPKPTQAELDALWGPLLAERARTAYIDKRVAEYPALGDFADAYYWSQNGDNTKMTAYLEKCDAVKVKYPKPS